MSSWRALARLGWRNTRRSPWRTLLVVALIATPVALVVGGATAAHMAIPSQADALRGRFGHADVIVHTAEGEPPPTSVVESILPHGARMVVTVGVTANWEAAWPTVFLSDVPVTDPMFEGAYTLLRGRAPTRPWELAPDRWMVDGYGVELGDRIRFEEYDHAFTVVGVAVQDERTHDQTAFVAPGTLEGYTQTYIDADPGTLETLVARLAERDLGWIDRRDDPGAASRDRVLASGAVLAGGVIAVGLAGVVASSAFAVSARRRQRELGLLGAVGADPRMLRRAVLLEGAVAGLVGGMIGVVVGLTAVVLVRPRLEGVAHRFLGPLELNAAIIGGGLALGCAGAAFAAWLPGRAATRQPVIEALAARHPPARRRGRVGVAGLVVAGVGLAAVAGGAGRGDEWLVAGGAGAAFAGVLLAAPVLVERLALVAPRLPLVARMGVRDLARSRTRSSAVFASVCVALAVPVASIALVRSERAHRFSSYVPSMAENQIRLAPYPVERARSPVEPGTAEDLDAVVTDVVDRLDGVVARGAVRPAVRLGEPDAVPLSGRGGDWSRRPGYPPFAALMDPVVVADRALLQALGIAERAPDLEAGVVLGVGPGTVEHGSVELREGDRLLGEVTATEVDVPFGSELPRYLIGEARALELGFTPGAPMAWLLRLDHVPSSREIAAMRAALVRRGVYESYEAGRLQPGVMRETLVMGVAGLIALGITGIVVALGVAEGRRERALLGAVGAAPATVRAAGATGAGTIVGLAGVAAALLGTGLVGVFQVARPGAPGHPAVIPWSAVAFATLAVPLAAYALAWLLSSASSPGEVRVAR